MRKSKRKNGGSENKLLMSFTIKRIISVKEKGDEIVMDGCRQAALPSKGPEGEGGQCLNRENLMQALAGGSAGRIW